MNTHLHVGRNFLVLKLQQLILSISSTHKAVGETPYELGPITCLGPVKLYGGAQGELIATNY